jgi:hypothetical protein
MSKRKPAYTLTRKKHSRLSASRLSASIKNIPTDLYKVILQYSGIDYPGKIRNASEFVLRHRRVPPSWTQDNRMYDSIEHNFSQQPLSLPDFQHQLEEQFRRKQLVNRPMNGRHLKRFTSLWDAYLFWNPSKRPANYQEPPEDVIFEYEMYTGPREITYEYQNPQISRQNEMRRHRREWN